MTESLPDSTQLGGTPNSGGDTASADAAPTPKRAPRRRRYDPVTANVLYADHITIKFGGLIAVNDVSFSIPPKSIVSLIGPERRREDDVLQRADRALPGHRGHGLSDGRDVTPIKPHLRAAMGLARTFQNIRLFNLMTAEENVMVAMHSHLQGGGRRPPSSGCPASTARSGRPATRPASCSNIVGIGHAEGELARNLSYGDQRRLEIARAMALRPKVLLLDEPTAGMNPQESATFNDFVHRVRDERDMSVLLIEHDMSVIMKISERITVLDRGAHDRRGHPGRHSQQPDGDRGLPRQNRDPGRQAEQDMSTDTTATPSEVRGQGKDVILELKDLNVSYGNIAAVKDLTLTVYAGEIVTLIGSNGAGKSTTLRTISGLLRPRSGDVIFKGNKINGIPGHEVVKLGICQSPEGRKIFQRMTVSENLDLGAYTRKDTAKISEDRERVLELFPRLRERIDQKAGTMSGGEQQMLAVARALLGNPSLLLLDEPSMGLAPVLVDVIFETIERIREQGVTVLLVEQNALAALEIADYAYVLESGKLNMEGPARRAPRRPVGDRGLSRRTLTVFICGLAQQA